MLSQSVTQSAPTADLIELHLTVAELETLNGLFQHLGTLHLNGLTINSPLITALRKLKSESYIRSCNAALESILNTFKNQNLVLLTKDTYTQFCDYLICVTGLSFKYYTSMMQLTDLAYDPEALAALCLVQIKIPFAHLFISTKALKSRLQAPMQPTATHAIVEDHKRIFTQLDSILTTILNIIDHSTNEENKLATLELLDFGYSIYSKLEKIKLALNHQKIQIKDLYRYSAIFLIERLLEHPQLNENSLIASRATLMHYCFLFATTNHTNNINKAYQRAFTAITHYESQTEDTNLSQALKIDLYGFRIIQLFTNILRDCSFKDMSLARTEMEEMILLSKQIPAERLKSLLTNDIEDQSVRRYFATLFTYLDNKFSNATIKTIDLILNDLNLLSDLLIFYQTISIFSQVNRCIHDDFRKVIEALKVKVEAQKACFAQASIEFERLSNAIADRQKQFEQGSQQFLAQLTQETETKIHKKKPKQSKPLPVAPKLIDAEPQSAAPEPSTPPANPHQLADDAKLFFSTHPYIEYLDFVNAQTSDDKAEALLYAADYHLLADDFKNTLTLFQVAYDLAIHHNPVNQLLIDNLKFSLETTTEYLKQKLINKEHRKAWLENNRDQFILLLGYERAAYFSWSESSAFLKLSKAKKHQVIYQLGRDEFIAIGEKKAENQLPVSKYTQEREHLELEKKELEVHIRCFNQLSKSVNKHQTSGLQANSFYKKPAGKSSTGHGRRRKMRK